MELMDSLDTDKWQTTEVAKKEGYEEFQVMRQHKKLTDASLCYCIQKEYEDEPQNVEIEFCKKDKDPLKNIGTTELKLKDGKVVGIDLDGDCVELKQ